MDYNTISNKYPKEVSMILRGDFCGFDYASDSKRLTKLYFKREISILSKFCRRNIYPS